MNPILKRKTRLKMVKAYLAVICLLVASLLGSATTAIAQGGPISVALTIHQSFIRNNGEVEQLDREIQFQLSPVEPNNPMPAGSVSGVYTFGITGATSVQISPIIFPGAGVFRYEIRAVAEDISGLTLDARVFTVEIIIANDGRYAYNILVNGSKTERISFEHIIMESTEPTEPMIPTEPPVGREPSTEPPTERPTGPEAEPPIGGPGGGNNQGAGPGTGGGRLPQMGDDLSLVLWLVTVGVGLTATLAGFGVYYYKKKRCMQLEANQDYSDILKDDSF
ncbi:MAG: hypothetical protein FWE25_05855 [Lachnospiraceae bacterium]|nr:hypothetical protein [Lachnospiraceae bacterium]